MKVTREMIGAAHDICLKKGDFVLSAALLERIYLAMDALANHTETSGSLPSTPAAEPVTTRAPEGISREHLIALAKKCRLLGDYTTREIVDVVTGYARVVLNDPAVQEAFMRANTHPAAERSVPDGYALVPIKPTKAMIEAGMRHASTVDTYKAMLAAAPKEQGK